MEDAKNTNINIKTYDFEKSRKFSTANVKFLNTLSDECCKTSNLQLQYELKHQDLKFSFADSKQESLSTFRENTDYNAILTNFSIGRVEDMIIRMDKICALTFVECLLGGDGTIHDEKRDITDIDIAILNYLEEGLFKKIPLDSAKQATISIKDSYTNTAQFRTSLSTSETLFVATLNVTLRDTKIGEMSVAIPLSGIEDIINELISKANNLEKLSQDDLSILESENIVINTLCENKVTFDVVAELGKTTITVGELLELDTDDVLILGRKINEPIDVLVGGSLAYKAQPGILGLNKAITIEDFAEKGEANNDR